MKMTFLAIAATTIVALPLTAHAQGPATVEGAAAGGRAAGPVGAVVGGTFGAAVDVADTILGVDEWPRFREYVVRERVPSYRYREEIRVGAVLPSRGVRFYEVPAEYHVGPGYRYTVINDQPVIVEPRSRRIVEIIE